MTITINKSQGQTLKIVGLDLRHPVFSHGMLYVAVSRTGQVDGNFILATSGQTRNVFPEALNWFILVNDAQYSMATAAFHLIFLKGRFSWDFLHIGICVHCNLNYASSLQLLCCYAIIKFMLHIFYKLFHALSFLCLLAIVEIYIQILNSMCSFWIFTNKQQCQAVDLP